MWIALSSPITTAISCHRLDERAFEVVIKREENVEDETAVLIRCAFWTNDHSLQAIDPSLIHPVSFSTRKSNAEYCLPEEDRRVPGRG